MTTTAATSHPLRHKFAQVLTATVSSRAAWFFAGVWLAAALVLTVSGYGFPVNGLLMGLAYLLFSLFTVVLTQPNPAQQATTAPERRRVWLQLGIVVLFIVLTAWNGLVFHAVVTDAPGVPLWSPFVQTLQRLGGQWFGNDNFVANPVTYVVVPLVVLLLAGARLPGLGFARGHRVGRVLLLWAALPLAYFAYALLAGPLTLGRLLARFVSNFLQNGFFEEFLFRGALQTRLRRIVGPAWALVLQALLFGVWHLGLGYSNTGHTGLLLAVASTVVYQAVAGLAFGVLFERTRNLLVPSVVHILVNSLG